MFNPALHQHPDEASLVGLLVAGYPELDICLCHVCGLALGNKFAVLGALHKVTSAQTRIEMANQLCRHVFEKINMAAKFGEAIGAITYCRKVRNQYAHAQWASLDGRLAFLRAENVNWTPTGKLHWSFTSLPVLQQQESYFEYTRKCLMWLEALWGSPEANLQWPEHIRQPPLREDADQDRYQLQG